MGGHISHLFEGKCPPSRIVDTKYGAVVGRRLIHDGEQQVDAFQGIPYAAPPVGDLRFALPQPPAPWSVPLHCEKFAPRGIQKDALFFTKWKYGHVSEDNLYLNVFTPVWTPSTPKGFPVMVFIHGGGFVSDSAVKYGDIGICRHLVSKGVVVVTIQYRLGYLGFWSTGDDACPDNVGLWDMTCALKWVQDNIAAFNGDPANVTVFGQSAGGASVDLLTLSPHSRDLFHRVIPMAGNSSAEWAQSGEAVETCREFAASLGVEYTGDSRQFIEELRKVDATKFGTSLKLNVDPKKAQTLIGPRFDGNFFPRPLAELRKEVAPTPRMVGCCRYEGIILMLVDGSASIDKIEEIIAKMIPEAEYANFRQLRQQILDKVINVREGHDKEEVARKLAEVYGDLFLNISCQQNVLDALEVDPKAVVYFYSYDYFNPKMWGLLRFKLPFTASTHCTELSYLFAVGIISDFKFNDSDNLMLDRTSRMWTNFAKFGDPNGSPSEPSSVLPFKWEPASADCPQTHLRIDITPEMQYNYHNGRPMWWIETRKKKNISE